MSLGRKDLRRSFLLYSRLRMESDDALKRRLLRRTDNPIYVDRIRRASGVTLEALAWMYGLTRLKEVHSPA